MNKFRPFAMIYYLILFIGSLWAMHKWIIIPLMAWKAVRVEHILVMWLAGLVAICIVAIFITKEAMK